VTDRELAARLLLLAERLEATRPGMSFGIVRAGARRLAELAVFGPDGDDPPCRRCGQPITTRAQTGRPRVLCETCSPPKRTRKNPGKVHGGGVTSALDMSEVQRGDATARRSNRPTARLHAPQAERPGPDDERTDPGGAAGSTQPRGPRRHHPTERIGHGR